MNIELTTGEAASLAIILQDFLTECADHADSLYYQGEQAKAQAILAKVEQAQAREARYAAERGKSWEEVNADNAVDLAELHRKCRPFSRWATDEA